MDRETLDIVRRLAAMRLELGQDAYRRACQATRVALGREALSVALARADATEQKKVKQVITY